MHYRGLKQFGNNYIQQDTPHLIGDLASEDW